MVERHFKGKCEGRSTKCELGEVQTVHTSPGTLARDLNRLSSVATVFKSFSTAGVGLLAGPVLFLTVLAWPTPEGLSSGGHLVLATTLLMAIWWMTNALPVYATALVPLVILPMGAVVTAAQVSTAYMDTSVVLFMGGFFIAMAIQRWGLHRRIALEVLWWIGGSLSRLVLGFMVATAFLSMWVSNTATAVMMVPIAAAVVTQLESEGMKKTSPFPKVLMLSVAYSASIGGIATLIGTPPNLVFASQFAALFPEKGGIGFAQWILVGAPLSVLMIGLSWFYLTRIYCRLSRFQWTGDIQVIHSERAKLGPMKPGELRVAIIFALTALAWIFRRNIVLGSVTIPGWASQLGLDQYVHDSTVAILAALALFAIPADFREKEFLLDWDWAVKIPWGILLLFGGGIALARGYQSTGLTEWVGSHLQVLEGVPVVVLVMSVSLLVTFLTELTSNLATATLFMPILAGMATPLGVAPELLMIPAAISASCAFMLPIATPPNAIVFASGHLSIPEMVKAGVWLNLVGVLVTTLVTFLIAVPVFGL